MLAMYHDQALIPIKTPAFDTGVNVTLGLPFVTHVSRITRHGLRHRRARPGKSDEPDRSAQACRDHG